MPRQYKCRKCGVVHAPPTGKHCRNQNDESTDTDDGEPVNHEAEPDVLQLMIQMKQQMDIQSKQMGEFGDRLVRIEQGGTAQRQEDDGNNGDVTSRALTERNDIQSNAAADGSGATPDSLRRDMRLMRQAAARLARLETDDSDDDIGSAIPRQRSNGKKSGATLTANDSIEKTIDWPHFHVKRMAAGKRKVVQFGELRVEEFVYGFIAMLKAPKSKLQFRDMIDMLQNMMQDTMEFSWPSALTFYETLGQEVERKETQWDNNDRVRELRMQYARTVFPGRRENKEAPKPQLLPAPPGMKCCIPFQRKACESERDHPPFTHACTYCFRTKAALCRHAEDECMRKNIDATKNGRTREQ